MKSSARLRSPRLRMSVVTGAASLLFAVVATAFWYDDVRYSLPTPRPAGLHQPPLGAEIPVGEWLTEVGLDAAGRPVLLHFFNPDCPCSRFNIDHLRALHARFGERVLFVAAVQTDRPAGEVDAALEEIGIGVARFIDHDGQRATAAGVYSTPQAVLVDARGRIVYRGNYNTSRYCTDPRTEFVRIALERLFGDGNASPPDTPAYGCELPAVEQSMVSQAN